MKMKLAALGLVSAAAMSLPSISMAQSTMSNMTKSMTGPDSGWFVGGTIGQSKGDCGAGLGAGSSCDDSDTAFRIFGGYMFNRHFGAELGYSTLGEVKASSPAGSVTVEAKAWDIMAVGILPVADKFNVYGKLGWYKADSDASGLVSSSDSASGLTYAIGAGYDFNKNLGLRLEWQQYKDVGGSNVGGETDVDVIGVSVVYRFK